METMYEIDKKIVKDMDKNKSNLAHIIYQSSSEENNLVTIELSIKKLLGDMKKTDLDGRSNIESRNVAFRDELAKIQQDLSEIMNKDIL